MNKIAFLILPYLTSVEEQENSKTIKLRSFSCPPLGVLNIATYLKNNLSDIEIEIFDCNIIPDYKNEFVKFLNTYNPSIIGFSMMFDNCYHSLDYFLNEINNYNENIITVLGGAATSFVQDEILKQNPLLKAVCYGDGEIPFLELCTVDQKIEYLYMSNNWIIYDSNYYGAVREKAKFENLDEVTDIDYSFIDLTKYKMEEAFTSHYDKIKDKKQAFVITSRGCPFDCVFCMNSSNFDKSMRYCSVEILDKHIEKLVNDYGINALTIYDDQILLNKKRAKEIFSMLSKYKLRIEMPNGVSIAFIDEELSDLMWNAGVDTLYLAIESGSEEIIKYIGKPIKLNKVKEKINILRKYDYWLLGYFVTGLPWERNKHREQTLEFIKENNLDWASFSLASPVRGSKLYNECIKNNYINKDDFKIGNFNMPNYVINNGVHQPEEITFKNYLMNLQANFIDNYRMRIGDYVTAEKVFQYIINKYPTHALAYYYLLESKKYQNKIYLQEKNILNYILSTDNMWRKIFQHFYIILED